MDEDIQKRYSRLQQRLTEQRLKELTTEILELYKGKNETRLRLYAQLLQSEDIKKELPLGKLFLRLVKIIHPDRLLALRQRLSAAAATGDPEELRFFESLLNLEAEVKRVYQKRFDFDFSEEYSYGEEDFGYHTADYADSRQEYGESCVEEWDFISALKSEYLGNLDYLLSPADLVALEGELVLAGYGLEETDGLQYCRNINRLDLSDNRITNLYDLQKLFHLEELLLSHNRIEDLEYLKELNNLEILDLSHNEIEDVSVLMKLENLKFVDLRGNPVRQPGLVQELQRRGVVVVI